MNNSKDISAELEAWCNSNECKTLLGCDPVNVSWPESEQDGDGETFNVWVEVELTAEDFNRVSSQVKSNYEDLAKPFVDFGNTIYASAEILTCENSVTFKLNYFKH